mmetsp:Transcript_16047/g.28816  ORF Transcript_16047/g.28816 Transcript_16047/m.28816 type:complete len:233 (-) Transcript_16047:147-845(-)
MREAGSPFICRHTRLGIDIKSLDAVGPCVSHDILGELRYVNVVPVQIRSVEERNEHFLAIVPLVDFCDTLKDLFLCVHKGLVEFPASRESLFVPLEIFRGSKSNWNILNIFWNFLDGIRLDVLFHISLPVSNDLDISEMATSVFLIFCGWLFRFGNVLPQLFGLARILKLWSVQVNNAVPYIYPCNVPSSFILTGVAFVFQFWVLCWFFWDSKWVLWLVVHRAFRRTTVFQG